MAETDEAEDGATEGEKPARGSLAAPVKAWSDAVSALMKATLFLVAVCVVAAVGGTAIWREQTRRTIPVEIDPNAEKVLRDRGTDIDLRATLIDDLNADMGAVERFIRTTLFNKVALGGAGEPISLKPFGVDATTGDIGQLYRSVFGSPDPYRLRIGILCPAGGCEQKGGEPARDLTLLVELTGPERGQRLAFRVPSSNPGLRRGLRAAMETASEKLLEQIDPLLASLFYLNLPNSTAFPDDWQRYGRLAAGAASQVAPTAAARGCMAEIVFYGSTSRRTFDDKGLSEVAAVAERPDVDPTCRYAGKTTAATWRMQFAMCQADPAERGRQAALAAKEMEGLDALLPRASPLEGAEIRQRQLVMQLLFAKNDALGDSDRRDAACGLPPQPWDGRPATFDLSPFEALAAKIEATFARQSRLPELDGLVATMDSIQTAIPRGALAERDRWAATVARLAEAYLVGDPRPRALLNFWGDALRERAQVRVDAKRLRPAEFMDFSRRGFADGAPQTGMSSDALRYLRLAKTEYENASAVSAGTLLDGMIELDSLISAADLAVATGAVSEAKTEYARAVQNFADRDAPARETLALGRAASRWLAVLIDQGACQAGAPRDAEWDRTWVRLGAAPDHAMCDLARPQPPTRALGDQAASETDASRFGLLALLQPMIAMPIARCPRDRLFAPAGRFEMDSGSLDRLACFDGLGATTQWDFTDKHTSATVDEAIEQAIAAR